MEHAGRGRRKKLIRAFEVARDKRHERPTCSECTEKLKRERSCNKPGESHGEGEGSVAWVFTSPALQPTRDVDRCLDCGLFHTATLPPESGPMLECPVGYTLREAPHVYDVLDVCSAGENASPAELARMPQWFRHALRIYRSESARHMETDRVAPQGAADADYGRRVLSGR